MCLHLQLTKSSHTGRLLCLTSWHAVPGPPISDAIFEAGVVIVLTAGGSVRVGHDRVVNGVGLCQGLEHHIIWTGAVLMGGALQEERDGGKQASPRCLDSSSDKALTAHLHLQHIIVGVPAQTYFVYFE